MSGETCEYRLKGGVIVCTLSEENEMTYEIEFVDFLTILNQLLTKWKNFEMDGNLFVLEKGKKSVEIHFLCSEEFQATRTHNGIRQRIKYSVLKNKWIYTEKHFIDGKRYEGTHVCKKDEVQEYLKTIPFFDAVMLKYAIKYDYVDFYHNKRIRLSFDCCYAIAPDNPLLVSPAFCYIEFENKMGVDLMKIIHTPFFDYFKGCFHEMSYDSHNRIRKCQQFYSNSRMQSEFVWEYTQEVVKNVNTNKFDVFQNCNFLNLRGEKVKERGSSIEHELKLLHVEYPHKILHRVREIIPPHVKLIKAEPRIITDVYFDNSNFSLFKYDASFRLRRQKKSGGWISCFKSENSSGLVLSRNKVQTTLKVDEILEYLNRPINGAAFENAQKFLSYKQEDCLLMPQILIVEYRDRYVLRVGEPETSLSFSDKHYDMKRREFVHIIFDDIFIYDLSIMKYEEIAHLICYGELDFTERIYEYKHLRTAEIEPNMRKDVQKFSVEIFNGICKSIKMAEIGNITNKPKYVLGIESIQK